MSIKIDIQIEWWSAGSGDIVLPMGSDFADAYDMETAKRDQ